MRFKRVALVNPPYSPKIFPIPVILPGLGYLAQSLRQAGAEVKVLDANLGKDHPKIVNELAEFDPDMVGISMISYRFRSHGALISSIRERLPEVTLAAGGPHVSSVREEALKQFPELDYAFFLDGEQSLAQLAEGKPEKEIPGLIYRNGSESGVSSNPAQLPKDLDSIPWPRYDDFELDRYGYGMSIVTSRGCPYSCIYCSCNVIGKTYRGRSPESVRDEVDYWYRRGYREFGLQEDNPTFDKGRMHAICDELIRADFKDAVFQAGNGVRADRVDKELLEHMYRAGFRRLAFGIESASDKVLKAMRKGTTLKIEDEAVRMACEAGFFVSLFFLIGTPKETLEDVEMSCKFALKYPVKDVSFYNLVPMPSTELWSYIDKNDLWVRKPEEYLNSPLFPMHSTHPVFVTPELGIEDRRKALKRGWQIRAEVTRRAVAGQLQRFGILGRALAWVYSRNKVRAFENSLLAKPWYRASVGKLRSKVRALFYK
ncbi:MAG: B12-binding domain-containing radical SAM protein [Candidatus Omnitrophica bacterium]|nr:B12-binding domain-containing radical SAM protein [Candidatus Omnitrophota bacterium]